MDLFKIKYGFHQEVERLVDKKDTKGKYILDIGCGTGWTAKTLLRRGAKKIVGIDTSENNLEQARSKKLKKLKLINASALDIPFKDNTFDTVVSFEVLEHLPVDQEKKMFAEAFRVLKPGGAFYLSTPYNQIVTKLLDPAWWLIGHRHYSKNQIREFSDHAGFNIKKIYQKGTIITSFLLITMYVTKWITKVEPFFYRYLLKKSRYEYKHKDGYLNLFYKGQKK